MSVIVPHNYPSLLHGITVISSLFLHNDRLVAIKSAYIELSVVLVSSIIMLDQLSIGNSNY